MKQNDEITGLFRNRLTDAEMPVREGFWEQLQRDLPQSAPPNNVDAVESLLSVKKKGHFLFTPRFHRVAAAASVVFVLGAASAAFWYFSPKEEIQEAFTQVAALTPDGSLKGDVVQETFPSIHEADPTAQKSGYVQPTNGAPSGLTALAQDDEESLSLHLSITITQRVYGNNRPAGNGYYNPFKPFSFNRTAEGKYDAEASDADDVQHATTSTSTDKQSSTYNVHAAPQSHKWAIKAAIGTALPKGDCNMPMTASVSAERHLNKYLALETGLQYNRLQANRTLHTLALPVKMNFTLASIPKVDLYATLGGAIEKCIAGAADNSFKAEPAQLSVMAGVGVRYKLNDRFALFAEPSVSHHFDTDSHTRNLRTERPTNLNLLCGVRMTY